MKRIEDIEGLDFEALDRIASDKGIKVPETLGLSIERTARTLEIVTGKDEDVVMPVNTGRRISIFSYVAAAVAVIAVLITVRPATPKDTFDDPYLALAEFERTMSFIQDKTGAGLAFAETKMEPVIEKTINVLK